MRRTPRLAVAAILVLLGLFASPIAAADDELPPGFTDGRPVGEELGASDGDVSAAPAAAATVGPAATTKRYFGAEPFWAVRDAVDATPRSCTLGPLTLTALVLAPVFKESSAATTAATAPSPMTLSRYDEWSGIYPSSASTDTNKNANYGLYAFRNPSTPYQRAYWHPGIGIWQYDSAGVGKPFTAVERMDVGTVAADVARVMAGRYCNPGPVVGHSAPYTTQERRYAAWGDWGYPCTLCEGFFQEMISTDPVFENLELVDGISVLGGTERRTCTLAGVAGTLPCWYVNPSVGTIQGATSWATFEPTGGGDPTDPPAPLSRPFYVLDRGTTEERHWLRVDTGYAVDIAAARTIGKNARPRQSEAGSGLTWSTNPGLCDVTTGRGTCTPLPPAGVTSAPISIIGDAYRTFALDVDGDDLDDVLFYGPGSTSDGLWLTVAPGSFSVGPGMTVNLTYDDVLTGDVDGDGDDDIIWYQRSSGRSFMWRSLGDGTFTSSSLSPGPGRRPFLLDRDGDGADEVFWYGPGSVADSVWDWSGTEFVASGIRVSGTYVPLVGDFDGNGRDDIVWYAPGGASDGMWLHKQAGGYVIVHLKVNGSYFPTVANLDGDASDDVFWYAPGAAGDYIWFGAPGGSFSVRPTAVNGTYTMLVADLVGTGRDGMVFYAPGSSGDYWWTWAQDRVMSSQPMVLPSTQSPLVGRFSAAGGDGVLWYGPGAVGDVIWYR